MRVSGIKFLNQVSINKIQSKNTSQPNLRPYPNDSFTLSFKGENVDMSEYLISSLSGLKNHNDKQIFNTGTGYWKDLVESTKSLQEADVKINLIKDLSKLKVKYGDFLDAFDLSEIAKKAQTKEQADAKVDLAEKLVGILDEEGDTLLSEYSVMIMVGSTQTKEQSKVKADFAKNLTKHLGDTIGDYVFESGDIAMLVESVNTKDQAQIAKEIMEYKDENGEHRFDDVFASIAAELVQNKEDAKTLSNLIKSANKDGSYRFTNDEIREIFDNVKTPTGTKVLNGILELKDEQGDFVFNKDKIIKVLNIVNDKGEE